MFICSEHVYMENYFRQGYKPYKHFCKNSKKISDNFKLIIKTPDMSNCIQKYIFYQYTFCAGSIKANNKVQTSREHSNHVKHLKLYYCSHSSPILTEGWILASLHIAFSQRTPREPFCRAFRLVDTVASFFVQAIAGECYCRSDGFCKGEYIVTKSVYICVRACVLIIYVFLALV